MTIEERHDGNILVTYDSTRLTWLMLSVGGVCLATAGYESFIGPRGTDHLAGLLGAASTCLLVAIVFPRARLVPIRAWHAHRHVASPLGAAPAIGIDTVRLCSVGAR
jgi:hypothetical protein